MIGAWLCDRLISIRWPTVLTAAGRERGAEAMLTTGMAMWVGPSWQPSSSTDVEPPEVCPYFVADEHDRCEYCGEPPAEHQPRALRDIGA